MSSILPAGRRWRRTAAALLAGAALAGPAVLPAADLAPERQSVATLSTDATYRLYLSDPVIGHLIDGRMHVIDGRDMRYLAAMSTGYVGQGVLSPDRRWLYVATTYYSRLHRGQRTDVVDVYSTADLSHQYEIEIPPKHAQALNMRAMMAVSTDGRWLLVQNATPASSVSVVDLAGRKLAAEVPTPGCWGVIAWPHDAQRFSTVCGDGTLATLVLDDTGQPGPRTAGVRFFDADADPVFMHYEWVGRELLMLSFGGQVHSLSFGDGGTVRPQPVWSLVSAAERKAGWRPGGYQLFTVDAARKRLIVGMHPKAAEGSHKTPAQQLWVMDLEQQRRAARWPGQNAVAMTMAGGMVAPRLYVLDGATNSLVALDPRATGKGAGKPLARMEGVGETPIYLEAH